MTAEDQRTRSLPAGLPLGRVFVSYAHDPVGKVVSTALIRELTARGCDVTSDHDLAKLNPSSIQAWMDQEIGDRIVLCVLSPGFVRAFGALTEGLPPHAGVRYELRAVRQRIYDHRGNAGCPVVPVATAEFAADEVPKPFRGLAVERFDPVTGNGADGLVSRIAALTGSGGDGAMAVKPPPATPPGTRSLRRLLHDLEQAEPASSRALELVRTALTLVPALAQPTELLTAFPQFETVIKAHGHVPLMRTLSDECSRIIRSAPLLLQVEKLIEARVLICGRGWHLQRDHHLQDALDETRRGVRLAELHHDRFTAAVGLKCVGRIRRLLAEENPGPDLDYQLGKSTESLESAIRLFSALDESGENCLAVGACLSLAARTQLTRFRLLGDKPALERAQNLADEADDVLEPGTKDYYDLTILRAELAAARRRGSEAKQLLTELIESLLRLPGAGYAEILARALRTRACLTPGARTRAAEGIPDLRKAEEIFTAQRLDHDAASCRWQILKLDSKLITPFKVTREDVLLLERLETDPRVRLAAIAELKRQEDGRIGNRRSARKINWDGLLNRIRLRPR